MHGTRRELNLKGLFKLLQTDDRHAWLLNENTLQQSHRRKGSRKELFLNDKPAACETSTDGQGRTFITDSSQISIIEVIGSPGSFDRGLILMWPLTHSPCL